MSVRLIAPDTFTCNKVVNAGETVSITVKSKNNYPAEAGIIVVSSESTLTNMYDEEEIQTDEHTYQYERYTFFTRNMKLAITCHDMRLRASKLIEFLNGEKFYVSSHLLGESGNFYLSFIERETRGYTIYPDPLELVIFFQPGDTYYEIVNYLTGSGLIYYDSLSNITVSQYGYGELCGHVGTKSMVKIDDSHVINFSNNKLSLIEFNEEGISIIDTLEISTSHSTARTHYSMINYDNNHVILLYTLYNITKYYVIIINFDEYQLSVVSSYESATGRIYYNAQNCIEIVDDSHVIITYPRTSGYGSLAFSVLGIAPDYTISLTSSLDIDDFNYGSAIQRFNESDYPSAWTGYKFFISAWAGSGNDGYARIVRVNMVTYAITTPAAALEFDTSYGKYFHIICMSAEKVMIMYSRASAGSTYIKAINVNSNYTLAVSNTLTSASGYPTYFEHIKDDFYLGVVDYTPGSTSRTVYIKVWRFTNNYTSSSLMSSLSIPYNGSIGLGTILLNNSTLFLALKDNFYLNNLLLVYLSTGELCAHSDQLEGGFTNYIDIDYISFQGEKLIWEPASLPGSSLYKTYIRLAVDYARPATAGAWTTFLATFTRIGVMELDTVKTLTEPVLVEHESGNQKAAYYQVSFETKDLNNTPENVLAYRSNWDNKNCDIVVLEENLKHAIVLPDIVIHCHEHNISGDLSYIEVKARKVNATKERLRDVFDVPE